MLRLPNYSMQCDGMQRLPNYSMQCDGMQRLPNYSMQCVRMQRLPSYSMQCDGMPRLPARLLWSAMWYPIHHFRINRSLAGWAHSQRRVGVNITIPLH